MTLPNVLLVVMDSVRARNCSLQGHRNETTPVLESVAEEATTYTQARSPGTWSLPSHTSMFTGFHVEEHGIRRARHRFTGTTLWEEIPHRTAVFSENMWITDMGVGLEDGFDQIFGQQNLLFQEGIDPGNFALAEGQGQYVEYLRRCLAHDHPVKSILNGLYIKAAWDYPWLLPDGHVTGTPADVYTDHFTEWVDEDDEPWAACINYMDAHLPYEPEGRFDRWDDGTARRIQGDCDDQVWTFNSGDRPVWQMNGLEALYDGSIAQIDHELGRLRDALRDRGEWEDTLLIVTSDHGEGFGESSIVRPGAIVTGHGAGIHEVQLHVPLVVKFPGQTEPETHDEVVSLTEIPRVVRAALDSEWSTDEFVTGEPVLASSHGLEEPMEERARRFVDDLWLYNGDYRALFADREDRVEKQVTWRGDHESVLDVYDAQTARVRPDAPADRVAETFDDLRDAGVRESVEEIDVSGATEQRLEDLGYM